MPLAAPRDEADRRHRHAAAVIVDQHVAPARVEIVPADQATAADIADLLGIARDEPGGEDAGLDTRRLVRRVCAVAIGGRRTQGQAGIVGQPPACAQQRFQHGGRAGFMDRLPAVALAHVPQVEPADDHRSGGQVDHRAGAEGGDELRLAQRDRLGRHAMSPAPPTRSPSGPRGLIRTPGSTSRMLHPAWKRRCSADSCSSAGSSGGCSSRCGRSP